MASCALWAFVPGNAQTGDPKDRQAEKPAPSVLVVTVDALRRDHMSAFGYARATTPRIDALMAEGVAFENAFAPIARSLPAHVSLWTASWAHRHGVVAHSGSKNVFASTPKRRSAAEMLRERALRTASFVGSRSVGSASGLGAGFEFVDEPPPTEVGARENVRSSAEIAARACNWLEFHRESPFLLWTHFEGPAEPNDPPPELAAEFADDGVSARLVAQLGVEPERFQIGFPPLLTMRMFFPELEGTVSPTQGLRFPTIDAGVFARMIDRYDADIRAVDDAVGKLLDKLRELDRLDTTTVVFASAFGQSLGERATLGSGEVTLENLEIAMAVRLPRSLGAAPRRLDGFSSLIDLLPTALSAVAPEVARELIAQGDGRDLLAEGASRDYVLSQRTQREIRNDPGPMYVYRTAEWTFVRRPELTDYLFDRRADPRENKSVVFDLPERAEELRKLTLAAFGLK